MAKRKKEDEIPKSSLINNEDFIRGLSVVQKYLNYVRTEETKRKMKIAKLENKAIENINKSENILQFFHLVRFIEKDRRLLIEAGDEKKYYFRIESLTKEFKEDRETYAILEKRIADYKNELVDLIEREKESKVALQNLEPPKKIKRKGLFSDSYDANKKAENDYNKQKRKLEEASKRATYSRESMEFQIDTNAHILEHIKETDRFIASLSESEKNQILKHYALVKNLFDENEEIYKTIRSIEKSKLGMLSLENFAEYGSTLEDAAYFERLVIMIRDEYSRLKNQSRRDISMPSLKRITDLTKFEDFGPYNDYINLLTEEMSRNDHLMKKGKTIIIIEHDK